MQINSAYLPKTSDKARTAALVEAALLLQEVAEIVAAKKASSLTLGSRWTQSFRICRGGRR